MILKANIKTQLEVTPDEIFNVMNEGEKLKMASLLGNTQEKSFNDENLTFYEEEFKSTLEKAWFNRSQIDPDKIEAIRRLFYSLDLF